jgi:hypothetical protein
VRREVAACQAYSGPVRQWLTGEVDLRGIRENAAVLVVLEIPDLRDEAAKAYARNHPDCLPALEAVFPVLTRPASALAALKRSPMGSPHDNG